MHQELWLRAKSQVLSSLVSTFALRATAAAASASAHGSSSAHIPGTTDRRPQPTMSNSGPSPSYGYHAPTYPLPPPRTPNLGLRSRTLNNAQPHSLHNNRDNGVRGEIMRSSSAESPTAQTSPMKNSRTHQELHKELLLAHKKGLGLCSKPELHQVLERRKREQTQKEEGEQARTPLEQVLLKRQQKHLEREKQQEEQIREEAQLLEFVRVRQNLRKIHTAFQRATVSHTNTEDSEQND